MYDIKIWKLLCNEYILSFLINILKKTNVLLKSRRHFF